MKLYDLKDLVLDSVPFEDVFVKYTKGYTNGKKNVNLECLECNHNTMGIKSDGHKGYAHCFRCGESWDMFKIVQESQGITFAEAVYLIAYENNLISEQDYKAILAKSYKPQNLKINKEALAKKKAEREKKQKEKPIAKRQSAEVISRVLEEVKELSPLTEEQYNVLKGERALLDWRIKEDYFNCPNPTRDFMDKLLSNIKTKYNYEEKDLIGVPGFYYNKESKRVFLVKKKGLAFFIRNAKGEIQAIHYRKYDYIKDGKMILKKEYDEKGKKVNKYSWYSSYNYYFGCTSGAPVDIILPYDLKKLNRRFRITEGKFKGEKICENENSFCASVQGVTNWKNKIRVEIDYISENYIEIETPVMTFDADMGSNFKVYGNTESLVREELEGLNVKISVWDENYGKGYDDVMINGNIDKVIEIDFEEYAKRYHIFLRKLISMFPNSKGYSEVKKDNGETVFEYSYNSMEIYYKDGTNVEKYIIDEIYKSMVLKPLNVPFKKN